MSELSILRWFTGSKPKQESQSTADSSLSMTGAELRAAVAAMETHGIPIAEPVAASLEDVEWKEYQEAAAVIGLSSGAMANEKLRRVLRDENIHTYNIADVINYLDEKLGTKWRWRGLRPVDAEHLAGWAMNETDEHRAVNFGKKEYTGAVPLPVLLTVKKIMEAVPEAHFYVSSDPKEEEGDPFLLVTSRVMNSFVVERWDEPSFRSRSGK